MNSWQFDGRSSYNGNQSILDRITQIVSDTEIFIIVLDMNTRNIISSLNVPQRLKKFSFDELRRESKVVWNFLHDFIKADIKAITETVEDLKDFYRFTCLKVEDKVVCLGEVITKKVLIDEYMNERLKALTMYLEFAPVFFVTLDREARITYINSYALQKTGYRLHEVLGKNWFEIFVPASEVGTLKKVFKDIMDGDIELRQNFENEIITKDGKTLTILWENRLLKKGEKNIGTVSVGINVTEQKIKSFEEETLIRLLSMTSEVDYHVALDKLSTYLSEHCGFNYLTCLIKIDENEKIFNLISDAEERFVEPQLKRIDKEFAEGSVTLLFHIKKLPKYASDSCLKSILQVILSFFERVYYIQKLEEASFRDALTGLFNRRYSMLVLKTEILRVKRYGITSTVVMLDMDGLKQINDTYGHDAGDLALREVAKVLQENLRVTDLCARYGGDEFVILMPETDEQNAKKAVERMLNQLHNKVIGESTLSFSAGVTKIYREDDQDGISVLKRADELLYLAKKSGKNTVLSGVDVLF